MSEKKYDIVQITKDFCADHEALGYVQTYWKYFHPDIGWHLNGGILHGIEASISAITAMDTLYAKPYATLELSYIAQADEDTVMLVWIESTQNKETGRATAPYSITGQNLYKGLCPTIFRFKDGLIIEKKSYYDPTPYYVNPKTVPMHYYTAIREKPGEKYAGE